MAIRERERPRVERRGHLRRARIDSLRAVRDERRPDGAVPDRGLERRSLAQVDLLMTILPECGSRIANPSNAPTHTLPRRSRSRTRSARSGSPGAAERETSRLGISSGSRCGRSSRSRRSRPRRSPGWSRGRRRGAPMPIVFTTRRPTGSMRVTVPSAHISDPDPTLARRDGGGLRTDGDRSDDLVRLRIDRNGCRRCDLEGRGTALTRVGEYAAPPPATAAQPRGAAARWRRRAAAPYARRARRRRRARAPLWGTAAASGSSSSGSCARIARLEPLQFGPWLEAKGSGEQPAAVAIRVECVGLPAASVERQHPLPPKALT